MHKMTRIKPMTRIPTMDNLSVVGKPVRQPAKQPKRHWAKFWKSKTSKVTHT